MCIRNRAGFSLADSPSFDEWHLAETDRLRAGMEVALDALCLLYTSDAADERSSVDLGGRRIIKKKKRATSGAHTNASYNNS